MFCKALVRASAALVARRLFVCAVGATKAVLHKATAPPSNVVLGGDWLQTLDLKDVQLEDVSVLISLGLVPSPLLRRACSAHRDSHSAAVRSHLRAAIDSESGFL